MRELRDTRNISREMIEGMLKEAEAVKGGRL